MNGNELYIYELRNRLDALGYYVSAEPASDMEGPAFWDDVRKTVDMLETQFLALKGKKAQKLEKLHSLFYEPSFLVSAK